MADGPQTFHVQILTPEGEVFDGDVRQLSTRTDAGDIGILANHVPVMARLQPTELRLHLSGDEVQSYAQGEGWLEVFANRAMALVQEAVPPDQLDTADLKEKLADAEQRLGEAEEGTAVHELAQRDRVRAETFLKLAGAE